MSDRLYLICTNDGKGRDVVIRTSCSGVAMIAARRRLPERVLDDLLCSLYVLNNIGYYDDLELMFSPYGEGTLMYRALTLPYQTFVERFKTLRPELKDTLTKVYKTDMLESPRAAYTTIFKAFWNDKVTESELETLNLFLDTSEKTNAANGNS